MAGMGLSFGTVTTGASLGGTSLGKGKVESKPGGSAVDEFLAYMKQSLAERMADAWLKAHGLDREKLKAMKPEDREAVLKQMAEELKQQLQQAAAEKAKPKTDAA
jgi:hypothetical protein